MNPRTLQGCTNPNIPTPQNNPNNLKLKAQSPPKHLLSHRGAAGPGPGAPGPGAPVGAPVGGGGTFASPVLSPVRRMTRCPKDLNKKYEVQSRTKAQKKWLCCQHLGNTDEEGLRKEFNMNTFLQTTTFISSTRSECSGAAGQSFSKQPLVHCGPLQASVS